MYWLSFLQTPQCFTAVGSPPTDVTAVQDGPTSIRVSWTPPSPLGDTTGYRISFTGRGISGGNSMSHTLTTGLTNGETYTISIVATSNFLPNTTVTVDMDVGLGEWTKMITL